MRTTVDIPDAIYRKLKSRAAREGSSTKKLILRGVEQVLRETPQQPSGKRLKLPLIRSKRPGSLRIDNAALDDLISFP